MECTCQPAVLSKCGSPDDAHLPLTMCESSGRSYSVRVTFVLALKTGRLRRAWRLGIDWRLEGSPDQVWAGLARHGRPIKYAHVPVPLELWDVWTPIAGPPVAFEPPS